ncbi:hypothetical protein M9H77_13814 [Catharanthus roseus]|uniref:Uncharacterized protein n=1 Tax=Catharanthus roseus TaxID=4058 RepID=A0ACC0BLB6_CATRO|nr:hypothetical protein M9H77_13814 [Catharanthus roseus]
MRPIGVGEQRNGIFFYKPMELKELYTFSSTVLDSSTLWHIRGGEIEAFSDAGQSQSGYSAAHSDAPKKKVVVLGTGWAATSFLKSLKDPSYKVQVTSPRNYFAYQWHRRSPQHCGSDPQYFQEGTFIFLNKKYGAEYEEAECYKIDVRNKKVNCRSTQQSSLGGSEEFEVDYDYLAIAMGARPNTFNNPGVMEHAHFLKEVEDAQRTHRSVIDCFERASLPSVSEEEKMRILHFVVVGGGPAGVVFAGELHDFVTEDVKRIYSHLQKYVKITLVEATGHILNMFDKRITKFAEEKFLRYRIELKTGSTVVKLTDKGNSTKEMSTGEIIDIPFGMVVWATGIGTRPVIMEFMKEIGQVFLATDEWLRVEGCESVYALGDCGTINQRKLVEDIAAIFSEADENNSGPLKIGDFKEVVYQHLGQFAPLGGEQTAAQLPGDWVSIGQSTQWLWHSVYASKLVSWRTRFLVVSDWTRRYIFGRD